MCSTAVQARLISCSFRAVLRYSRRLWVSIPSKRTIVPAVPPVHPFTAQAAGHHAERMPEDLYLSVLALLMIAVGDDFPGKAKSSTLVSSHFARSGGNALMKNALYYGDNLSMLRESIKDESVDLVYLDPPFNSNASYNVLFKAPSGQQSKAQIEPSAMR